jgi:hypothetical protein
LVPPVAAVLTLFLAPDPHGHWTEHLWSAYLDSAQLVVLIVLAAMLGWRALSGLLLISLVVIAVGIAYQVLGNYQVADSIWGTRGDPGSAAQLTPEEVQRRREGGQGPPTVASVGDGYDQGHDRAATGDLVVIVGGAAFAIIAGVSRRVPPKVAGLAMAMVLIPPPFLWPAAGVLMLLLYGLTSQAGFDRRPVAIPTTANGP